MATIKLRKWDSAEHLKTDEDIVLYLKACLEEAGDDAAFIAKALGTIARAKGMSQLAKDTGWGARACTRRYPAREPRVLPPSSRSSVHWVCDFTQRNAILLMPNAYSVRKVNIVIQGATLCPVRKVNIVIQDATLCPVTLSPL